MVCEPLYVLRVGTSARLEQALAPLSAQVLSVEALPAAQGKRLLFAVAADRFGAPDGFLQLLRLLRRSDNMLTGCVGGVVIDGEGELYTKAMAQELVLAANMAGCTFPGKPLVEGTGSLYNQHILAKRMGLTLEQTYFRRVLDLGRLVRSFRLPRTAHPRLLMLHASDNARSNTLWLGRQVVSRLPDAFSVEEMSLQNGTIHDCRGCSYETCSHFAAQDTCFYGGAISEAVQPAILACDAMLFLCPNYNDAVSANLMALFNRLTNLLTRNTLEGKCLFGIVVSGYSGSDIVARQLLGAMCLNKTAVLPPHFCMLQTAHDPGSACRVRDIDRRLDDFARCVGAIACDDTDS